jgi:hypothetical protein
MNEQLRKLAQQIREQKLAEIVEEPSDELSIEDYAKMEPPRGDYSKKPERFTNVRNYLKNMDTSVSPYEGVIEPNTRVTNVNAFDIKKPTPQEIMFKTVRENSLLPNTNAYENIEKYKEEIRKKHRGM